MNPVRSPKRPDGETAGLADLYPYYAGYSYAWAENAIASLTREGDVVLDPWNGSGTTTLAAASLGRPTVGVDLNPAAWVIAQAKLPGSTEGPSEVLFAPPSAEADPLGAWIDSDGIEWLRQRISAPETKPFSLLAAMRVVRSLTSDRVGSNPTWVRPPKPDERPKISRGALADFFDSECRWVEMRIAARPKPEGLAQLLIGHAGALPLADGSVNFVMTSPPYLTRIDYTVAFRRELAVLGFNNKAQDVLRRHMMGTTRIRHDQSLLIPERWGSKLRLTLNAVRTHGTKDAAGYYLKQKLQYFADLDSALGELSRVSTRGGLLKMVVQDSYFKDVPLKLSELVPELAHSYGWELEQIECHPVARSLVTLNVGAKAYKKMPVVESEILLRKVNRGS